MRRCGALAAISLHYAHDDELLERQAAFLDLCRGAFLRAVQDARSHAHAAAASGRAPLQTTGALSRQVVKAAAAR